MDEQFECLRCNSICLNPITNDCPYCGKPALVPLGSEYFIDEDDTVYADSDS